MHLFHTHFYIETRSVWRANQLLWWIRDPPSGSAERDSRASWLPRSAFLSSLWLSGTVKGSSITTLS